MRLSRELRSLWWGALLAAAAQPSAAQVYEEPLPTDHPVIRYWRTDLDDPVTRLVKRFENRKLELDFHGEQLSYLPSLLEHLGVSADSQVLVFSKTSLQKTGISPRSPRAIYFSDEVAIGFVPGSSVIELAAVDPRQGVVFYTLNAEKPDRPRFARPSVCLECHQGPATLGIPGMYVGSVATSPSGRANFHLGTVVTDHRTPFEDRWGGWYVTGTHGGWVHRGNAVALDPTSVGVMATQETQNLTSLVKKFDTSGYPAPSSDIVALMTLEHQTQMTNLLTRLNWEARIAAKDVTARDRLDARIDEVVRYMLFADEISLEEPIQGVSSFTESFPRRGPRDVKGRSLRDFDLRDRLFQYPLSYMVYSAAFDALPDNVREPVLRRIYDVLAGETESNYANLSAENRTAIREILRETKSNLPAYWTLSRSRTHLLR